MRLGCGASWLLCSALCDISCGLFWYKAGKLVVQLNLYSHKPKLTHLAAWLAVCGSYLLLTSHIINLLLHYPWSGNMGKYSALRLYYDIVPPFSRANTATLELNISPYCPPCSAIMYRFISLQSFPLLTWH